MAAGKPKKEKIFHPQSRKAAQVERAQLRKSKIVEAQAKKVKRASSAIDKYLFFFHAIPPESEKNALTREELHELVRDVWLCRHDVALEEERKARRKGRSKSTKELNLEFMKEREAEEYRTGLELPDITHPTNVALFRKWDQSALEYIDLLRFIRINSQDPTAVVVSRPGKHESLKLAAANEMAIDS
ncbi:TMA16 [Sanghuangporus vaninii]